MKKKLGVYSTVAESIRDFSEHRLNRQELYEIICNCLLEITNDERSFIFEEKSILSNNPYIIAKRWLINK
jgi:hypothetical protein